MKAGARAAIAGALALAACSSVTAGHRSRESNAWTVPGVLRYAIDEDPKSLNPAVFPFEPTYSLAMFAFAWAVQYDEKARPFPDALRELPTRSNGDVSPDGLTLRYKLARGLTWQDGDPLTCADLRFTWQLIVNPHGSVYLTEGYSDIRNIDCSDPYVAVVHMKRVYAPFLPEFWSPYGWVPILPEHILKPYYDARGSLNVAPYNALPVGSGPFRIARWRRGDEIRLSAFSGYLRGRPRLKEVDFKILPVPSQLVSLQSHAVDMIAGSAMDWPRFRTLAADPRNGLRTRLVDEFAWAHIDFNMQREFVADRRVRVALAYALDRRSIIEKVFHGVVVASETDQDPRFSWAATNDIAHYPYDPKRARAILDAAGWRVGPDGIRVKNGRRLEFSFSACTEHTGEVEAQAVVQQQWRSIGVQTDVKNYSHNLFLDASPAGILTGGRYDVAIISTESGPDPDRFGDYDDLRWTNAAVSKALDAALHTVDQRKRKRYYVFVQQQIAREVPTIVIGFIRTPLLYNSDLKDLRWSPVSTFIGTSRYSI